MTHPYEPEPSQRTTDDYDDTDERVDELKLKQYELCQQQAEK